ncbi:hypothetical protein F0562_000727 [Nyssa sinensis]|uniref:Uncharacterized protein n=1 Tax=Nyssa sinensis TaxID=561372 RepID=A0A5J5C0X7_9ASTE|nr:hypothetical protein F0562_000727 [Nyssa sinensis]
MITKRMICRDEAFEDDDDDDQKMEKFCALITRVREARDYIRNGSDEPKVKPNKINKVEIEKPRAVWNPSFLREDFAAEDVKLNQLGNPSMALLASSQIKEGNDEKEDIEGGLDLKLSL